MVHINVNVFKFQSMKFGGDYLAKDNFTKNTLIFVIMSEHIKYYKTTLQILKIKQIDFHMFLLCINRMH